jgi:hypothetical protein
MGNDDFFGILEECKELILFTEIIGWLHDIDKLDERFFCLFNNKSTWPDGKKIGGDGHKVRAMIELNLCPDRKPSKTVEHGVRDEYEYFGSIKTLPEKLIDFFNESPPFTKKTQEIVGTSKIGSPILKHHRSKGYPPSTIWEWMICGSDSKDSKEDRGKNLRGQSKLLCSPFGNSLFIDTRNLRKRRCLFYQDLYSLIKEGKDKDKENFRIEILRIALESFESSVADNRYPANDISLMDHNYMTGAISKSVLLAYLFNKRIRLEIQNSGEIDRQVRNKIGFQALSITFDFNSYFSNSIRLPDLAGRIRLYHRIRQSIKELLESEIPIGTSIYEDMTNIVFLTPELDPQMWKIVENALNLEIEERIISVLKIELSKDKLDLETDGLSENEVSSLIISLNPMIKIFSPEKEIATLMGNGIRNSGNYLQSKRSSRPSMDAIPKISEVWKAAHNEKCHVCGLLPVEIHDESLCRVCYAIRYKGRHGVREGTEKDEATPQSLWLDEIKDENNTIALIVGKVTPLEKWLEKGGYVESSTFINSMKEPKNLSASRARAILRTVDKFIRDSSTIIKKGAYGCIWEVEGISKQIEEKLDNNPNVSLFFNGKIIEGYIYVRGSELETINALDKELANDFLKQETVSIIHKGDVIELKVRGKSLKHFYTSRVVYSQASEFISIVPARLAVEGILQIKDRFDEFFNKVHGRLSLNLGLIFFKHKAPLYVALDSAKRMLENLNALSTSRIDAEVLDEYTDEENVKLKLNVGEKEIEWLISTKFADGQDDSYYPYFFMSNGNVKHVSEISQGEVISIHPSYFDFEFLETSTRRFDIILENGKRPHKIFNSGPRPYYLEEVDTFKNLWDFFCGKNAQGKKITSSQIQNFQTLLVSKIEEWGLKNVDDLGCDTFKTLVEDSITRILGIEKKIEKDGQMIENQDFNLISKSVSSGLFFDVFELYVTIMKQKPEGDENEQS